MIGALMFGSIIFVYGAEPKEPKLIKEIKFDHKIKKFTDNVVVTEKELVFLDEKGNIRRKKKLPDRTSIILSKDDSRIGQKTAYDVTEKGPGRIEFKMLDENGEELWQTAKKGISDFYVSQAQGGVVVEPQCHEGGCSEEIKFYDKENPNGTVVTTPVELPSITSGDGDVSADGNYFVVQYLSWEGPSDLILYDITGELLWKKHFEEQIGSIAISPNGNFVIAETSLDEERQRYIHLFNRQGDLLLKQPVKYVGSYHVKFSADERYVAAASDDGNLYLIETSKACLLKDFFTGDNNIGFLAIDISSGFVAGSVTTRNPKNLSDGTLPRYLYLFNFNLKLLLKKKFDHGYGNWNEGPKIQFKDSGKKILASFGGRLLEFENEYAK